MCAFVCKKKRKTESVCSSETPVNLHLIPTHSPPTSLSPCFSLWLSLIDSLLFLSLLLSFLDEELLFNSIRSSLRRKGLIQRRLHCWAEQFSGAASWAPRWNIINSKYRTGSKARINPTGGVIISRVNVCSLRTFTALNPSERCWLIQIIDSKMSLMEGYASHLNLGHFITKEISSWRWYLLAVLWR